MILSLLPFSKMKFDRFNECRKKGEIIKVQIQEFMITDVFEFEIINWYELIQIHNTLIFLIK